MDKPKYIRELLDPSYLGVKRLFVLAYVNTEADNQVSINFHQKYFFPRGSIGNWNIEIDGRNFYDQPINDLFKECDEVRKVLIGQGDDCATDKLITADLTKQKPLDGDSRAIQQITFTGTVQRTTIIYYILEQSKETVLKVSKGTAKVL